MTTTKKTKEKANAKKEKEEAPDGCTLKVYARAKGIPEKFMKEELKMKTIERHGIKAVMIPYSIPRNAATPIRYRISLDQKDRFRWKKGTPVSLYGLWKLDEAEKRGYVVLVDGESDCHTLWYNGFPAVGVPGAVNWNEARDTLLLKDIPRIYLVRESDHGEDTLYGKLKASPLANQIRVLNLHGYKDVSEMYLAEQKEFKKMFKAAMKSALSFSKIAEVKRWLEERRLFLACEPIARADDILEKVTETLTEIGVVGEKRFSRLVFLALVTRLSDDPVSILVTGESSSGKSYVTQKVVSLFPEDAVYILTSMSAKAMIYTEESFEHRFICIYEAAGIQTGFVDYTLRTLLSEGKIVYEVTEKDRATGVLSTRRIEKRGPTGIILTTTRFKINPENENRCITVGTNEGGKQTRRILRSLAKKQSSEAPDVSRWIALHLWLAENFHEVDIPYVDALSKLVNTKAVRIRRDFRKVLELIKANALIHQLNRNWDDEGRIVADIQDYEVVYDLVSSLISDSIESSVSKTIRETVDAVCHLLLPDDKPKKRTDYLELEEEKRGSVSVTDLANRLRINKSNASRRMRQAAELGYLENQETRKGKPAKYILGEALPNDTNVFPEPKKFIQYLKKHGPALAGRYYSPDQFFYEHSDKIRRHSLSERDLYRRYRKVCAKKHREPAKQAEFISEYHAYVTADLYAASVAEQLY